jgi:ubiquinone/menaquinone biosynthesis C-methylase UbiE
VSETLTELPSIEEIAAWRPEEIPEIAGQIALKRRFSGPMLRTLRAQYVAAGGASITDPDAARALLETLPALRPMLWLNRHMQDRMWAAVGRMADARMEVFVAACADRPDDLGTLTVAETFRYPSYYEVLDFHRQYGGVWRDLRGAVVYMLGARVVHLGNNDRFELHDRFAEAIDTGSAPTRVLDVGCGFGKNAFSLKLRWPEAEVHGVDLSAPCLRLARRMATERGLPIHWRQGDAEALPYADASFDLVTIAMVLHELPQATIHAVLRECLRVIRPGGRLVMLENRLIGDPLRDWLLAWHSQSIAEPYWMPFRAMDIVQAARDAGFRHAAQRKWYAPGSPPEAEADPNRWFIPWAITEAVA